MYVSEFIKFELERIRQATDKSVADLTPAELKFQPTPACNPVGLLYFHMARAEDRFVQEFIQNLKNDYKILIFWDKYYVLKRLNRKESRSNVPHGPNTMFNAIGLQGHLLLFSPINWYKAILNCISTQ